MISDFFSSNWLGIDRCLTLSFATLSYGTTSIPMNMAHIFPEESNYAKFYQVLE
jgi:hypothetical protein